MNSTRRTPGWFLSLLGAIVLLPARALSQDFDASALDAIVKDALKAWHVPGVAVAIVRDDQVVYLKGFGVKEADKDAPVTPDTLFPIGSCTKAFTTTALAMLVDDGKMRWDDPVRKHVPYFRLSDPSADTLVTLRDLVSHRTGVGSNDLLWYRTPWDRAETIRRIGQVPLKYPFRDGFEYQTTMFTTAGQAVENTSKIPWEDFVRKRILLPLEMTNATFTTPAAQKNPDHASPHRRLDGQIDVIPWYRMDKPEPAGSINASARDLAQWVRFQLGDGTFQGKRLVSAGSLAETHTPQNIIRLEGTARAQNPDTTQMTYGMAWVIMDYRGQLLISHAGAIDGFRAHLTLVPKAKLGIVILNNLERTALNLALCNSILDLLLGLPRKNWNAYLGEESAKQEAQARTRLKDWEEKCRAGTKPTLALEAYAGTYEDPAYGPATVRFQDGSLVWKWESYTGDLLHCSKDTFLLRNETLGIVEVNFNVDPRGNVTAMKVAEPMRVEFKRGKAKGS